MYLIWSFRHRQWWGQDRAGYTLKLAQAGRYNLAQAADITINGGLPGGSLAVDEETVKVLTAGCDVTTPQDYAETVENKLENWKRL